MRLMPLATIALFACITPTLRAAPAAADAVVSPEVQADRRVTFRVYAPKAADVSLYGDWMPVGTKQVMTRDNANGQDNGVWSVTVGPLNPGISIYSFTVDGMTIADPVNSRVKLRWRTSASLVEVPGGKDAPQLWEPRDVPHGKVEQLWQTATALDGETRAVWVYVPPGYVQNAATRYPVLYLLHGHNDTAAGWTMVGGANFILDNLIAERKAVPVVVVMPFGHAVPYTASREAQSKNTALVEQYLLNDVMPAIEREYRIAPGREHCAIAGYSMGGGHALQIGLNHLDRFSAVCAFSSAVPADFEARARDDAKTLNAKLSLFWIGCGKDDPFFPRWQKLHEMLDGAKVRHTFQPSEGAHVYAVWRRDLGEVAPLLFGDSKDKHPSP
jgi:enterochelin esterase family protein